MEKLIYLWNIGSVNQISIKQEIRCFTNKSISWKPSFIIVRALNTYKPKIPQIYDKIMKLSLSTIWFILHFCRKCWEKHPWKSLTLALFWAYFFFSLKLNNLYIYINGKEILCWFNSAKELCYENCYFFRYEGLSDCYVIFLNMLRVGQN